MLFLKSDSYLKEYLLLSRYIFKTKSQLFNRKFRRLDRKIGSSLLEAKIFVYSGSKYVPQFLSLRSEGFRIGQFVHTAKRVFFKPKLKNVNQKKVKKK